MKVWGSPFPIAATNDNFSFKEKRDKDPAGCYRLVRFYQGGKVVNPHIVQCYTHVHEPYKCEMP